MIEMGIDYRVVDDKENLCLRSYILHGSRVGYGYSKLLSNSILLNSSWLSKALELGILCEGIGRDVTPILLLLIGYERVDMCVARLRVAVGG